MKKITAPLIAAAAAAAMLAACQTTPEPSARATAALKPTKGNKTFGEADFEQVGNKVRVAIFVQGLKPGQEHGLHIHEAGGGARRLRRSALARREGGESEDRKR